MKTRFPAHPFWRFRFVTKEHFKAAIDLFEEVCRTLEDLHGRGRLALELDYGIRPAERFIEVAAHSPLGMEACRLFAAVLDRTENRILFLAELDTSST